MAATSRKPVCQDGSKRYIPPMTRYRNVDIAGKTPALGLGVPREFSEKEMFACLTRADSCDGSESPCETCCASKPWISNTSLMVHINLLTMDDTHHSTRHQHHQVYLVRRSLPGSLIRMQKEAQGSWVFRRHVFKQPDEPAAVKPVVLGPLDEASPSKPIVPEIVHLVHTRWIFSLGDV